MTSPQISSSRTESRHVVSWFCNKCKPKALNAMHSDKDIEDRCAEYMSRITKRITRVETALEEKSNKGRFGEQYTGNKHTVTDATTGDQEAETSLSTNCRHSPNNDSTNQPRPGFSSEGRNNRKRTDNGKKTPSSHPRDARKRTGPARCQTNDSNMSKTR